MDDLLDSSNIHTYIYKYIILAGDMIGRFNSFIVKDLE